jgi:hypothetical protein
MPFTDLNILPWVHRLGYLNLHTSVWNEVIEPNFLVLMEKEKKEKNKNMKYDIDLR